LSLRFIDLPDDITSTELTTTTGEKISIAQNRGSVTILAFINARDSHSPNEIELLNKVKKRYQAHGLKMICFLIKHSDDPEKLFEKYQMNFPFVAKAPLGFVRSLTQILTAPAAIFLPCNVVLRKDGKAVYRIGGWSESTMKQLCDQIDIYIASNKHKPGAE
jgi:peroxiredoxin